MHDTFRGRAILAFSAASVLIACSTGSDGDDDSPSWTPQPSPTSWPSPTPSPSPAPSPSQTPLDVDQDGWTKLEGDCNDRDETIHPGAPEDGGSGTQLGDTIDNDCDGTIDEGTKSFDDDGDGWTELQGDCHDGDPAIHPSEGQADPCPEVPLRSLSEAAAAFDGEGPLWAAGYSVAIAGDVDGDGFNDLLVGTQGLGESQSTGRAYLISGGGAWPGSLADATSILMGEEGGDLAGYSVAGAGDVNGDGFSDILIGAPGHSQTKIQAGRAYVVLGPISGPLPLGQADTIITSATSFSYLGVSVSSAGDMNGDGFGDIVVGAPMINEEKPVPGRAYVFFGPLPRSLSPEEADVELIGEMGYDRAGESVSLAGDVNGDGHPDLLVGAIEHSEAGLIGGGKAYLLNGPLTGQIELADATASFLAEAAGDLAGGRVRSAGDVNGDGFDDILIGAHFNGDGGTQAGKAYLFYGPVAGAYNLAQADATFVGEAELEWAGIGLASAGDFNADGFDDILVGAPTNQYIGRGTGRAYLFPGPLAGPLAPSDALLVLEGEALYDRAGFGVCGGDLDGDGDAELVIGAPYNDQAGDGAGSVYIVEGG